MYDLKRAETVADLSSAATVYTLKVATGGVLNVSQITGVFEEAVASGGFTSTAPVVTVSVGGTALATYTTGTTATAKAIGDEVQFTPNTTNAPGGVYVVTAGDTFTVAVSTAGTGGTVTGTLRVFLPFERNLG